MANPRAPEDVTEWPGAFDALHERVSRSLECKGFGTWNELRNYVDSLKNIRTQIFQLWLEELTHWGAIVNFPTVVKCYTSRVVESMSAGSPCIACEIPDRPRNRALFTENKEILFFDPHSPESLLAQIKKIQRDPEFGQLIARNALGKVRQFHTAEVRVQQILQWIQTGQEPRYSEQESEGVVGKGERGEPMSEHLSLNNNHRNQEFGEPMMKSQNTIDENPHNPILEIASLEGKEALVSVIIPTLDRPEFLRKAVKSILNQTYRQFEIIVINDGGTDTGEILSNIDVGERITYVRLPQNRERSHARNVGITLAKGKYIAYLDDDDQFLPDHLKTLVTFLETSNYEIAYTDAYRIVHEKKNGRYLETHRDVPYSYEFSREILLRENFIPILSIMHLRSCFDRTGFFDESLNTHEDWDLWIRMSEDTPFYHIKKVTAEFSWRMDGSTTTSSRQEDFLVTKARILQRYGKPSTKRSEGDRHLQEGMPVTARSQGESFCCSIIMPVFNKNELTQQCLTHLAEVTDRPSYEVIVIDNASSDGTADFLASLGGDIHVITNKENFGFAKACNQGAAVAKGKYLVFLNNDTIPQPNWLAPLVQEVEEHDDVAVVGSMLLYPDKTIQHAGVVFSRGNQSPYHYLSGVPQNFGPANVRREFHAVTAASMLVRKDLFVQVDGFDEGYKNSFEDVDLCLKIRACGKKVIYQPKSWLYHLESQTPGRKDHDAENSRRFSQRWSHQWIEDEDLKTFEMGCSVNQYFIEEKLIQKLESFGDDTEQQRWERVRDVQKLLHEKKKGPCTEMLEGETIHRLLAETDAWPSDIGVLEWAGQVCLTLKCEPEAQRFWKKLLTMVEHSKARLGLAHSAIKAGNFLEGQQHLDVLRNKFPQTVEGFTLQGILYMQGQKFLEAKREFEQAVKLDPDNLKAQLGLGQAYMGQGQNMEAWKVFEGRVPSEPDAVEVLNGLIQAGTALARWDELAHILLRFLERNPANVDIRFALAGVAYRAGQVEQTQQQLAMLRLLKPDYEGLEDLETLLQPSNDPTPALAT